MRRPLRSSIAPIGGVAALCLGLGLAARHGDALVAWASPWWAEATPAPADPPPPPPDPPPPGPCDGPPADGFDFPVGPPDAAGYKDAQPFGRNGHLGGDWNRIGAGNGDFGDPIHAIADGVVTSVRRYGGGWGLIVRIAHVTDAGCVESLYAHLADSAVTPGERVRRGARIGSMGDADGAWSAHLHLELRDRVGLPLGPGYGDPAGYLDPTAFIRDRRPGRGR